MTKHICTLAVFVGLLVGMAFLWSWYIAETRAAAGTGAMPHAWLWAILLAVASAWVAPFWRVAARICAALRRRFGRTA